MASHRCQCGSDSSLKKSYLWIKQKRVTFRTDFKENHWQNDYHIAFHFNGVFIRCDSVLHLEHFFVGYYRSGVRVTHQKLILVLFHVFRFQVPTLPIMSQSFDHGSLWRMVTKCDAPWNNE